MKKLFSIALLLLFFTTGCKKTIEQIAEDRIVSVLTSGQWIITSFTHNDLDITDRYVGYSFQYFKNRKVDAIKNGVVETTGQWDGDGEARTVYANFTNGNVDIKLINGTWKVVDSGLDFAKLSYSNGTETKTMRLDKKL